MFIIFAALERVAPKDLFAVLMRWQKLMWIFPLMALCVFTANAQSVHRVHIQIGADGTYKSLDTSADLTGSGNVSLFGAVNAIISITAVDKNLCNAEFGFTTPTPISLFTLFGLPISGVAQFTASSKNQMCGSGKTVGGIPQGVAFITAGKLTAGGNNSVIVNSGIFRYFLIGTADNKAFHQADGTWTLTGVGEIGLITNPFPAGSNGNLFGSNNYPAVVAGPGGSGYPLVSNGADGGSALVFDGAGSVSDNSPLGKSQPGGSLPRARGGSGSVQILLPVQSAAATYTVSANCSNAPSGCWVTIPTTSGTIPASSGAMVTANVSTPNSGPGVYPADIAITINPSSGQNGQSPSPTTLNVPLTAIVNNGGPVMALSQTGLQFQAVSGFPQPVPQSIAVANQGTGSLSFSANPSTLSGGSWLTVSSSSGTAGNSTPAAVNIQTNPAGLAPGVYFGRVDFTAQGAMNSPQSVEVVLTVSAASTSPGVSVSPVALNFVASGGANPATQSVEIANPSNQPLTLNASAFFEETTNWLNVSPPNGTATSAQPLVETVSVNPAGLTTGVHNAVLEFQSTADNTSYSVNVQLIVQSTACTPTKLLPVFTTLGDTFQTMAGLPTALKAQILDDCGSPMTTGSVVASFSTGDPAITMIPAGNGFWEGTWMPGNVAGAAASVTLSAFSSVSGVQGSAAISGALTPNPTAPLINLGGIVSAASLGANVPIAPGSFISIFGSNLASAPTPAASLPLQTTLGATQVLLGGRPLPLNFVGPNQINAIVPSGSPTNTLQQLMVVQNGVYSIPRTLVVAEAQPAVFTQNQSGTGPGVIVVVKSNGTQFLNTASNPASAGDALQIYCAGLGAVNPPMPDGMAASASPASHTVNPVTVTVGDKPAQVLYSGMAPGLAGLYQVNVIVPPGITPAPDVPIILTVAGQVSPPVTLAVH